MSRSLRLLDLLQILRRHRVSVPGHLLAQEAGVSLRTIRRDMEALQALGADIRGAPGVGYVLHPGFVLPPLSFTEEEMQALITGAQWVVRQTDDGLALAAQNVLAKIGAVIGTDMYKAVHDDVTYVARIREGIAELDLARVRSAIREQRKMSITYVDQSGAASSRTIWPILLGFVASHRFIATWCEQRQSFRLFRVDRIVHADFLEERYPQNRRQLVKQWRAQEDLKLKMKKDDHAADI